MGPHASRKQTPSRPMRFVTAPARVPTLQSAEHSRGVETARGRSGAWMDRRLRQKRTGRTTAPIASVAGPSEPMLGTSTVHGYPLLSMHPVQL
mmetsp:Transcript_125502/g.250436  ORF Transcript_125502/g.250436 Transcript_125502/m.250436 type:complete len:93 (+) Transcript_125502:526-804(+)